MSRMSSRPWDAIEDLTLAFPLLILGRLGGGEGDGSGLKSSSSGSESPTVYGESDEPALGIAVALQMTRCLAHV